MHMKTNIMQRVKGLAAGKTERLQPSIYLVVISVTDERRTQPNSGASCILKWNGREERNVFRNNCIIAVGLGAVGIIFSVLI